VFRSRTIQPPSRCSTTIRLQIDGQGVGTALVTPTILDWKQNPERQNQLYEYGVAVQQVVQQGALLLHLAAYQDASKAEQAAAIMLARHILEQADAMAVLVVNSVVTPCKIILRATLEAFLGLEYMLAEDTTRRATAYMVCLNHKKIKDHEQGDLTTPVGKELRALKLKDELLHKSPLKGVDGAGARAEQIRNLLNDSVYSEAEAEYQKWFESKRARKKSASQAGAVSAAKADEERQGQVQWFSLFDGPPDVQRLATKLGRHMMYEVMYRPWSALVHATDVFSGSVIADGSDLSTMLPIRQTVEAELVVANILNILADMYPLLVKMLEGEERLAGTVILVNVTDQLVQLQHLVQERWQSKLDQISKEAQ